MFPASQLTDRRRVKASSKRLPRNVASASPPNGSSKAQKPDSNAVRVNAAPNPRSPEKPDDRP
jgi:hypothetical protein